MTISATSKRHEEGYRAVLVREKTKQNLQAFRSRVPNKDLFQERRMVTAALDLVLDSPELHKEWSRRVVEIVAQDLTDASTRTSELQM